MVERRGGMKPLGKDAARGVARSAALEALSTDRTFGSDERGTVSVSGFWFLVSAPSGFTRRDQGVSFQEISGSVFEEAALRERWRRGSYPPLPWEIQGSKRHEYGKVAERYLGPLQI
jgi:hypothetical protein